MTETRMKIRITDSGERVIQDPNLTYQRIYLIFYWCINVGALSLAATVFMEKYRGFWTVNLMGLIGFAIGFAVLIVGKNYYVTRPPQGSILPHAFKAMWIGFVNGRTMEAAKPSYQAGACFRWRPLNSRLTFVFSTRPEILHTVERDLC